MVTYREATAEDAKAIAELHSLSWQQNYRGSLSDAFLDGPLLSNRHAVWQNRLQYPSPNQYIIVAELERKLCGFACAYSANDPIWGTLLDNLHVRKDLKGQGIGRVLIETVARWSYQKNPESGLYLWVLLKNTNAQKFYDKMGGINQELLPQKNPDGSVTDCYRYVWPDVTTLL
ncbi:GNAT family N-acetyltransferase [Spirosoma sp.]|uniref:GNAT family N-acetyltransferase n=1 Tax=Spirosoma sp. TaxID=1899569 RepID=UPI003B3AED94